MPFDIDRFRANLDRGGLAKSANFQVMVQRPFGSNINMERDLQFRCTSCSIPGRHIDTTPTQDFVFPKYVGYNVSLDDVSMRIILSEDLAEKIYFEEWVDRVTGSYRTGQTSNTMFDYGFYDDYALNTIVDITQFDATGFPTHRHTLREAFPISVGSVDLSWEDDSILYLDVTFKYRYYTSVML
jgi:hypothetical protein